MILVGEQWESEISPKFWLEKGKTKESSEFKVFIGKL